MGFNMQSFETDGAAMSWLNEPPQWTETGGGLDIVTGAETDFWQETHYGFRHDNGHFRYRLVSGDFTAETVFSARYESLYDQAGLMIRFSERCWLKAGVEFVHGRCTIGTVLTRIKSDWAIGPVVATDRPIRLRLTRRDDTVCVQWGYGDAEAPFETLRLGALSSEAEAMIGPMTCSPTRAGLVARFTDFRILPPVDFAAEV